MIDLTGEINAFGEEALDAAFTQAEMQNPATIMLNFDQVQYINSTGIALLEPKVSMRVRQVGNYTCVLDIEGEINAAAEPMRTSSPS